MAATLINAQTILAKNEARNLIFFEGTDLCYNYKTDQWTSTPAYNGIGYYSVSSKNHSIGLVRFSAGSVDFQPQGITLVPQTITLTTGAVDANQGGRVVVNGVRPLINGGTPTVRVGVQDSVSGAVSWSASTSLNSRTGMANFRSEGRYVRVEVTVADAFTTIMGADIDFAAQGRV
jgi:hypothetical protein